MNYGIPYQGSKSKIVADLCRVFPKADHFYDLFGGGFSVTHYMLAHRSKDYGSFHFNEIRPGITTLVSDAIAGKYNYDVFNPKWVSCDEFHAKKDLDPYIKMIWSFGNAGNSYLFGKEIEPHKRSMHNAVVFNDFDDYAKKWLGMDRFAEGYSILQRRLYVRSRGKLNAMRGDIQQLEQLERLERLQQLEQLQQLQQLERLERLEQLERLELTSVSYEQVDIKPNSIIYCDIPYDGTADYDGNTTFDRAKFLEWADAQTKPVYISEYNISDSRFTCLGSLQKRALRSHNKTMVTKQERVYVNASGARRCG